MGIGFTEEEWLQIPGFDGFYEANIDGKVRSWKKPGGTGFADVPRLLKPKMFGNGRKYFTLSKSGKKTVAITPARVMAITFLGGVPDGMVAYYKNGDQNDTRLYNIGVINAGEFSKKYTGGKFNRRPVLKVGKDGEVLDAYKSVKEAAERCYMSKKNVTRHLKKRIKNPFTYQDWTFVYDV